MNRRAVPVLFALMMVASVALAAPGAPFQSKLAKTDGYVQRKSGLWVPAKYGTEAPRRAVTRQPTAPKVQTNTAPQTKIDKSPAAANIDQARRQWEVTKAASEEAKLRAKTSGSPADKFAAMNASLARGRAKVNMVQAQSDDFRAKAQAALAANDAKTANAYQDQADQLSVRASKMKASLDAVEAKIKGQPVAAAVRKPAPVAPAPQADDGEKVPGVDAPQAKQRPVYRMGAWRDLSVKPTAGKGSYGRVKEQARANDFDNAYRTLQQMEAKAEGSHGLTKAWRSFQVGRAKRALRNEAARMMHDGAADYARTVEQPRLNVRMAATAIKSQLVHDNHISPTEARNMMREQMQGVGATLPPKNRAAFIQAERVLTQLSRVEQKHQTTFGKRLLGKLGGLVFGNATRTLHQANRDVFKQAERLAKQGPEGVISAHLLVRHAATRDASLTGKQEKMLGKALKNLDRTIKDARKSGDVGSLMLAYDAKETLRLDNPQDQDLVRKVDRDLGQFRKDMSVSSVVALGDLTEHAAWLGKMKEDVGAKQFMALIGDIKASMGEQGMKIPRKLAKQIQKVDDHLYGRDTFGYKWRTSGALGKAALAAGAVVKAPFKVAYGTAKFAVKAVTLPVWGPYKLVKAIRNGDKGPQPPKMDQQTAVMRLQKLAEIFNVRPPEAPGGPQNAAAEGPDMGVQMNQARMTQAEQNAAQAQQFIAGSAGAGAPQMGQ